MGNKQVCIGLHVDKQSYEAGSTMTGRVYLSVTRQGQRAQAVHLLLVGNESSSVKHHDDSNVVIKKETSSIVEMEVPLTHFPSSVLIPGQYEFPFEWELPSSLPSSMQCLTHGESNCKISYHLTATLYNGRKSCNSRYSSKQEICITARPSQVQTNSGLLMEPVEFPISSCCMNQGCVMLGWDTDSSVASPRSSVQVGIFGCNKSRMDIQYLQAQWNENVSWTARGRTKEITRTLAEAKISTVDWDHWHSANHHQKPRVSHMHQTSSRQGRRIVAHLNLPPDALDTYRGSLIQVRHVLRVSAVTRGGGFVTAPESSALVQVQRKRIEAPSFNYSEPHATPIDSIGEPVWAEANVLPDDWSPQQVDVVILSRS